MVKYFKENATLIKSLPAKKVVDGSMSTIFQHSEKDMTSDLPFYEINTTFISIKSWKISGFHTQKH